MSYYSTVWYFSRHQVVEEQQRYLLGMKKVSDETAKDCAAAIQEWLDKKICYYCGKPWTRLYNDTKDKFVICSNQKCRTMAALKYIDNPPKRWSTRLDPNRKKKK